MCVPMDACSVLVKNVLCCPACFGLKSPTSPENWFSDASCEGGFNGECTAMGGAVTASSAVTRWLS